ncbi:MAG: DNRLRE domain-containing protein [Candidatus Bathyarchaeia archaeon]
MKKIDVILLILLLYGATFAAFWATSVLTLNLNPTADSYSWQSVPLANNGGSDNFEITSYNQPPYNMRGWIEFNISTVPQNVWILSATLRLRLWHKTTDTPPQMGDPTGRVYGVYELTQPWSDWGVNWVDQPPWTDSHSATAPIPPGQGGWSGPYVWMEWDLTNIVKGWQSGVPNYGTVVRDTQENASLLYSTQFFTIHRVPSSLFFPRLVVTYLDPEGVYAAIVAFLIETALIGSFLVKSRRRNNFGDIRPERKQ